MLEAHDLAARRGDAQLFSGVSFSLGPGTALFVRGPNGSGKTTLLRILAGTTEAAQGWVLWRGERVGPFHPVLRACAIFIGHAPALKDELTVEENLASLTTLQGAHAGELFGLCLSALAVVSGASANLETIVPFLG